MKIVVIIPTYNERQNMQKMLPILFQEVFPQIKKDDMFVLVADDKSPDGTAEVVRDFQKKWKNIVLLEGEKEGLGAAYVRAMKYAMEKMSADAVIEFDADFQHDPNDIPRLVEAFDEGYGYVIGSRYVKGGAIPAEWGIDRKLKSYFGSLFARIVWLNFKIHDMTSGFKLTKTSYLKRIKLDSLSKNYAYKLQMLYEILKLKPKVKEIPIVFYERTKGKSKMDTNDLSESFILVLRLRIQNSKRVIKFLMVGGTGFIIQLITQEMAAFILFEGFQHSLRDGLAAGFGAEAAILSNFMFNNFWTFKDTHKIKERSSFFVRLVKFNLASIFSIFIQFVSVYIFVHLLGENINVLNYSIKTRILVLVPTIVLLVIPLNYLIYNRLIWKTHHLKNEESI